MSSQTQFLVPDIIFLGPHLWHMEVHTLGVELELQLQSYATATAPLDQSLICDLSHSFQQRQILAPWARPAIESASSWTLCWVLNPLSHNRNPLDLDLLLSNVIKMVLYYVEHSLI